MTYQKMVDNIILKDEPIILALESSCDETAAAVLKGGREVLSDYILSSASQHVKYGGVVPEIASRAHAEAVSKAVKGALAEAKMNFFDIDAIAVTYGAGLLGSLLVGLSYAKAAALALKIPIIPVSHIRGHLAAAYLVDKTLTPPFVALLASGGHTAILLVEGYDKFKLLGSTLDDAAGEAFDKVARVLSLEYPGGPNLEKLAEEGEDNIPLPDMLKNIKGYDFSYSGLKTAVLNYTNSNLMKGNKINKADLAKSFQVKALTPLVEKAIKACEEYKINTLTIGGGVAANGFLRKLLTEKCAYKSIKLVLPSKKLCTDNAAMIGAEAYIQYKNKNFASLELNASASVPLS